MGKIKLKWRIFGFLLGFCVLLLVILWLFQIVFLSDFYRHIRMSEIRRAASVIVAHLDDENVNDIVAEISERGDFFADILDMQGVSVVRAGLQDFATSFRVTDGVELWGDNDISVMRLRPQRQNFIATDNNLARIEIAIDQGGEFYEHFTVMPNITISDGVRDGRYRVNQIRISTVTRHIPESLVYVRVEGERAVMINALITPVSATVSTLRYQLYMISAIMLVLAVAIAIIIAKRVSRPIEEINRSALDLAKGNYDTRFNGKGFCEILELSDTLNTAAVELGRVESLRRELLANVSHDLRTPLALIYSYSEMMHDFPADYTPEQAAVIMEEAKRLTGLVNDVLDVSKLESGMEHADKTRFNLTQSLLETTERMRELLKNQNYHIEFNHSADIFIEADENKINRAFYNLLVNAVNYAGEDRKISVVLSEENGTARVSVTDNGEGIAAEDLPLIWDRYYKSGKAHKRAITGTGLGLSIVKKILELHGGTCGVESEQGRGSTFWFSL
ncbi:MAG: HAMP domain-containing histidine kinase [Defluviitaleaceae bacterium]|nr:HAMP domain-containing histidine kinase [Defluviitaleaceae bacterium]MCL2261703.1 HAMP domain-containing histidine kinase [Defluviitaleaceae bacterium]